MQIDANDLDISHNNNCKYFDVIYFKNCFSDSTKILLIHSNKRSFSKNSDEYIANVNGLNIKAEIMCFSGTWFIKESITEMIRYNSLHVCRSNVGMGGGISIHVRK